MKIPPLIYGTAWKKERTSSLVYNAFKLGFRGVDTAGQPRHYYEEGVGEALRKLFDEKFISRDDIFVQTKFTPVNGHDPSSIPYDPNAPLSAQVAQSWISSKKNLQMNQVDSLVLHSPYPNPNDLYEVWSSMEKIAQSGEAKILGISNCYDLNTFMDLFNFASIKPKVLQNRFYAETNYDGELRKFCRENEITYQSFWSLTANPHLLKLTELIHQSKLLHKTPAQIFFRYLTKIGITPLIGSCDSIHKTQDLDIFEFDLPDEFVNFMNKKIKA
jgi:diketogulonate reductase-like aldo/keto reductase